ncbi:MAG: hypothetical protein WD027_00075 [Gaiellales bacterium]
MERLAIVAHLKSGAEQRAAELVAAGPPFDPAEKGLAGHVVYLSAGEVIFVFEGSNVEWIVEELIDEPFQWPVNAALDAWRPLVEGVPRIARPAYVWHAA